MAKGRFFEEPVIYIILAIFSIFIFLTFDQKAGTVLGLMSLTALGLNQISKPRIKVNSVKGNTAGSWITGLIGLGITIGLSIVAGIFFLGWTPASFIAFNKAAILGAQTLPLAGNIFLKLAVFVLAFPIVETIITLQFYHFILKRFNRPLRLSDPMVWVVATIMGILAMFYHITAKANILGKPNNNLLLIIFIIFFVECVGSVQTKEMEPWIYHHILNNALSLL